MTKFSLLILCAGFGNRMFELTKDTPKPLLRFKNKILLGNTINYFKNIGCDEIFINTHYLYSEINKYIIENFSKYSIKLVFEPSILGTGGGIKNIFNYTNNKNICVVNSDIFWQQKNNADVVNFLSEFNNISHCKILLSRKNNFLGLKSQIGDFNIKNNIISKWTKNDEIFYYSGLQIVSRNIFDNDLTVFPMNEIWSNLIKYNNLKGEIINSNIFHIGDKKSFENF